MCIRVEQLEKLLALNAEKFKNRTKDIRNSVNKDLEEATMDAASTSSLR